MSIAGTKSFKPQAEIKAALKKKEEVYISGFGTFYTVKRKARKGRNPRTGEEVKVAARFMPRFKAAEALKETVNNS